MKQLTPNFEMTTIFVYISRGQKQVVINLVLHYLRIKISDKKTKIVEMPVNESGKYD
jgi:predicted Zn-dependent protease